MPKSCAMLQCKKVHSTLCLNVAYLHRASGDLEQSLRAPDHRMEKIMATIGAKAGGAYAGSEAKNASNFAEQVRLLFSAFSNWRQKRKRYYNTVAELRALSDRDLADIGMVRRDIPAIARQSASRG
jgi:uncharacterized protein YjiS (DUF1127 family)